MLAGEQYRPIGDAELTEAATRAGRLLREFNSLGPDEGERSHAVLDDLLAAIGPTSVIRTGFQCDYGAHLSVGDRCFANFGLVVLDCATVTIGDDVQIGPNVQLLTAIHPIDPELRRAGWESASPIVIGDNVWLGGGVVVLPGVTIGANTVVGAAAVVTRDLPSGVVALGNPARVHRTIS